jgi:hypothetical protein
MIKKLLSIVMLLAFVATISATGQKEYRLPKHSPFQKSMKHATMPQMKKAPAALMDLELEPGQAWFGYWNPEDIMTLGTMCDCDYALAIYIPNKVAGQGATIDGMRFYLPTTIGLSNVKAWISTKLSEVGKYADGYDLEIKNVETPVEGYNEVLFDKKYEIPEGGLYVGFYFDSKVDMTEYPPDDYTTIEEYYEWYAKYLEWIAVHPEAEPFAVTPGDKLFEGTMYFASVYQDEICTQNAEMYGDPSYLDFVGWFDYSTYGYYLGAEALIGGDKFLKNAATLSDFGEKFASVNQDVVFPVTITNSGLAGIQNFTYEVSINGAKPFETTVTLDNPVEKILDYTTVNVTFNTGEQAGTQKIELALTKVNGEPNEKESVAKGTLYVLSEAAKKKPLIEEYTGTWCGWCTRGWVALEKLAADFGDDIVLVASHNGDPMEIEEYMDVQQKYIEGYPSMLINRVANVDPYYGTDDYIPYYIKTDVEAAIADVAPASIAVEAVWADEEKTKINISTETKFFFEDENPSLAIGYILVADGLTGSGRSWAQANYYNEYAEEYGNDPYLGQLTQMDSYILDMTYNHVAVAGWGIANGVDGSISGPTKIGEAISGTFVADLNGALIGEDRLSSDPEDHVAVLDLIQDKELKVVAFLINKNSGEVINANQTILVDPIVGINAIEEKAGAETVRFNVSGQLIKAPQSGLNIIKLSDGTTLKVLVK